MMYAMHKYFSCVNFFSDAPREMYSGVENWRCLASYHSTVEKLHSLIADCSEHLCSIYEKSQLTDFERLLI